MRNIESGSTDPTINLALEEYFFKSQELPDDVFILWQDAPAVVIGRFQNTLEEVNLPYVEAQGIPVVRRISGGGAVYHDLGNLCFSFILRGITPQTLERPRYVQPIRAALEGLGLTVEQTGRNDLAIQGRKFSGNAMALSGGRLLFHGTLLFETNLDALREALRHSSEGVTSRGVKSVRSHVTNLRSHLPSGMDLASFTQALRQSVLAGQPTWPHSLTPAERADIQRLAKDKYASWDWTFGANPHTTIQRNIVTPAGALQANLEVDKGHISACRLQADFWSAPRAATLAAGLQGVRHTLADLRAALAAAGLPPSALTEAVVCALLGR